jgi:hypothetical protein
MLVVAIVAVMSLIAVKLYFEYGNDEFTPDVISSTNITDTSITVTFEVTKSDGKAATCTVQAFSYNGAEVGEHQVPVPAGEDVSVVYRLATTARAYTAEVPTCQPAA